MAKGNDNYTVSTECKQEHYRVQVQVQYKYKQMISGP